MGHWARDCCNKKVDANNVEAAFTEGGLVRFDPDYSEDEDEDGASADEIIYG